jgi:hypothetical protein
VVTVDGGRRSGWNRLVTDPAPSTVEDAAAELYGGPVDAFVAERDALVKALRAGGDKSLAAEVKALRKPTVAADALNRALRSDLDAVGELLRSAAELRLAQEEAAAGGSADARSTFTERQDGYRAALDAVVDGAPSHQVEVRAGIEAAVLAGLDDQLLAATFANVPEPAGGFGPFALGPAPRRPHLTVVGGTAVGRSQPPSDDVESDPEGEGDPESDEAEQARRAERLEALRDAERALATVSAEHRVAEEATGMAARTVAEIDGELDELEARRAALTEARQQALTDLEAAQAKLSTVADQVDAATQTVESLASELGDGADS